MRVGAALQWFARGERLAWRSLRAGTLGKAGLRPLVGAFMRPLTAPSRYPEYEVFCDLLRPANLDDPASWVLDVGSPKLFSILLAANTRATVVATDIWEPAIDEAAALSGGLPAEAFARFRLGVMDAREPVPVPLQPPGGKFAAAYSMSVIEHIEPDPGGDRIALQRMADAVRSGGRVVVSVPVDTEARSEYEQRELYGRKSEDPRGAFFSRVYDERALHELCTATPELTLETCVICEWPDHPLLDLQPKFPTAIGFAGASFPLIADRFVVGAPTSTIPQIHRLGDAILAFKRA